ncbi:hypothetical protein ACOSP7_003516 [Xanthoceras sorbifolium]
MHRQKAWLLRLVGTSWYIDDDMLEADSDANPPLLVFFLEFTDKLRNVLLCVDKFMADQTQTYTTKRGQVRIHTYYFLPGENYI